MAIILDIPPALRQVFGEEGSSAFISVFNQYEAVLRDGVEHMLTAHRQVLETTVDERFQHIEGSLKNLAEKSAIEQKRYADSGVLELKRSMDELKMLVEKLAIEQKQYTEKLAIEQKQYTEKLATDQKQYSDKLALEQRQYTDQRFNELERKMLEKLVEGHEKLADAKSSLIKWMFSFFIGSIITVLGVLIAYLQLYFTKLNLP